MLEEIRKLQKSLLELAELTIALATRLGELEEKFEVHIRESPSEWS